jgi:glycosyltransferase involved in cell wall biosynthesis
MRLSAVVLTKGGEELADCLKSLQLAEEIIIIVDSPGVTPLLHDQKGSGKLVVFRRPLSSDFTAQRNFGLEKARGDWVLFLDADERLSPQLSESIEKVLQLNQNQFNGYRAARRDFLFGHWLRFGESGKIELLRLAKRNAGRWQRPVHETWQVSGPIGQLEGEILHFPHQRVSQFLEEINFYTDLNAQYLFNQKIKVSFWQILFYPLAKFFKDYFLYLGFLDGMAGFLQAVLMSLHSFLTRAKLWFLWQKHETY